MVRVDSKAAWIFTHRSEEIAICLAPPSYYMAKNASPLPFPWGLVDDEPPLWGGSGSGFKTFIRAQDAARISSNKLILLSVSRI